MAHSQTPQSWEVAERRQNLALLFASMGPYRVSCRPPRWSLTEAGPEMVVFLPPGSQRGEAEDHRGAGGGCAHEGEILRGALEGSETGGIGDCLTTCTDG